MGLRWDTDPQQPPQRPPYEFEPLPLWLHWLMAVFVGFALCYLIFVP